MTQPPDEFRPETVVAIDAVTRALAIARRRIGAEDITAKGGRDLVTVTDVAVEDAVRGIAADALGFSVIGEERGGERRPPARRSHLRDSELCSGNPAVLREPGARGG